VDENWPVILGPHAPTVECFDCLYLFGAEPPAVPVSAQRNRHWWRALFETVEHLEGYAALRPIPQMAARAPRTWQGDAGRTYHYAGAEPRESGQATAEYALLVALAGAAFLAICWPAWQMVGTLAAWWIGVALSN
jgi:hypothetical protein